MGSVSFTKGPIKIYPLAGTEEYAAQVIKTFASYYVNYAKIHNLNLADFLMMEEDEEQEMNECGDVQAYVGEYITGKFDYFAHRNGAIEVSIKSSARRRDVYVIHTSSECDIVDYNGVNRHLNLSDQELLLYNALDAFLEAKIDRVSIFELNLGQARSDRPKGRGSCNLRTFFRNITANGANHLFTYQIHSAKSLIGLDNRKTTYDNMNGETILKKYILKNLIKTREYFNNVVQKEWIISSVDAGGKIFASKFAKAFKIPLLVVDKRRNALTNLVESVTVLKPDDLSIEGKVVFVVDDMIDSGGSIIDVCRKYRELGAKEVNVAVVYGLFADPAEERLQALYKEGVINRVIVTDLVLHDNDFYKRNPYIEIADTTYLTARVLQRTNMGRSLEKYFLPLDAEAYLRDKVEKGEQ